MKAILNIDDKEFEVEISEEQIKKLTEKKSPFDRACVEECFFCIDWDGKIRELYESNHSRVDRMFKAANYCADKDLIQQQAWRETLNRLLWRWQYENDEPVDWEGIFAKWFIGYDYDSEEFKTDYVNTNFKDLNVFFSTDEKANQAIEEVVKPFMKEHPDFVW